MCMLCAARLGIRPRARTVNTPHVAKADSVPPPGKIGPPDPPPIDEGGGFTQPSVRRIKKRLSRPE